jgi:hypothetical protein
MRFWTDSQIVLQYLRNRTRRFKPFVANPVAEILEETRVADWYHVGTEENPADYNTRGLPAASLQFNHMWYQGPGFLKSTDLGHPNATKIPLPELSSDDPEVKGKGETGVTVLNTVSDTRKNEEAKANLSSTQDVQKWNVTKLIDISHFSTWKALVFRTAWIRRVICSFASRLPRYSWVTKVQEKNLTVEEYEAAEMLWINHAQQEEFAEELNKLRQGEQLSAKSPIIQLTPFYDENLQCIRVGGRLQRADIPESAKFQILLPADHVVAHLLASDVHFRMSHCGEEQFISELRQKYWPLKVRKLVKNIIKGCLFCYRRRIKPAHPRMADLPTCRLLAHLGPFTCTGVDYFGPLKVKVRRNTLKRWGCLFTCLSTRGVHIELADSLETDDFILCLRNFIGRRGHPVEMFSDNGTNFRGANTELKECLEKLDKSKIMGHLTPRGISWQFNPPLAPHWGGAWERLVQSIKTALVAPLGNMLVTESVLRTALVEVEALLNNRPLTHSSSDINDYSALTPNHFLLGHTDGKLAPGQFEPQEINSRRRWRQCQVVTERVYNRWLKEYLPLLTTRGKWREDEQDRPVSIGDLVLVVDENLPRGHWELSRVVDVFPGDDGRVRSVKIKNSRNTFTRPVSTIAILEENKYCDV